MSQRRNALGRGLGALISNPVQNTDQPAPAPVAARPEISSTRDSVDTTVSHAATTSSSTGAGELDITLIDPNPDQPRREFDPAQLAQLSRSISEHGVLQPVVVRRAGSRFELVMGERRYRASQLAGRKTLPAVVLDVAPADRLELAIVENVQRQDLNPIELAHAYQALADAGHTQEEIGRKVSIDRSSVSNHIRLLDLSRAIQGDVEGGRLSIGHAKALLQVADLEAREALRARIVSQSLAVRAAEKAAREINQGAASDRPTASKGSKAAASLDPDTRAYVERIERRLQTKVALHPASGGGGKLEINFFNLEDLERIGGLLLGEAP
jgi:ParB family chromosome partitioning protein